MDDLFTADEEFDAQASKAVPEAYITGGPGVFVRLGKHASLFIIMPRADSEVKENFYMPTLFHYGLFQVNEQGERRPTARPCLIAEGLGPCAVCDIKDMLKGSTIPGEEALFKRLTPKKKVFVPVWWLPLEKIIGSTTSTRSFKLADGAYSLKEAPSMKILGLPPGVWKDLKMVISEGGIEMYLGPKATPLYILGNGEEGMARRYKEPRDVKKFYDDLRPAGEEELLDIRASVEYPTPREVAELVEQNFPGRISSLDAYGTVTTEEEKPATTGEVFE